MVASYLVAAIVLQGPGGKLGDRIGHRRVLALGLALVAVGAVLGAAAGSIGVLAVARVLMAAGGAAIVPATLALLRIELPAERRGRAFGLFGAVMSLAAGIGPVVGGELVRAFGWPSIFAANLPVIGLASVLAAGRTRRPGSPRRSPFDVVGTVLLTAALAALVLGLDAPAATAAVLLGACAALVVPLVWWERRATDPVVAFGLFGSRAFTAGSLLVAFQNLVMYTLLFELPQVLAALLGADPAATGRLLVALTAAMIVASLVAGRITDRVGARLVALGGTLASLGAVGLLAAADLSSLAGLVLPLAVLGVGVGLATPAAQSASLTAVAREHSGAAAGIGTTMRYLGGVVGVALLGRLVDLTGDRPVGRAGRAPDRPRRLRGGPGGRSGLRGGSPGAVGGGAGAGARRPVTGADLRPPGNGRRRGSATGRARRPPRPPGRATPPRAPGRGSGWSRRGRRARPAPGRRR
ncbi:MFS transporter [Pseudonocardia zijingensis]|uniref:MFS transporter n=1 Tax=Pseudonocardia zijingensis TaxID=153376 RepID=A0ABP4B161_9PSEU